MNMQVPPRLWQALLPASLGAGSMAYFWLLHGNENGCQQPKYAHCAPSLSTTSDRPFLAFLGTGSSTGCPKPLCTMTFQRERFLNSSIPSKKVNGGDDQSKVKLSSLCQVSNLAIQGDPKHNRDYRNNPSFLIHHYNEEEGNYKNIIIDTGKTFREGALRWFPTLGISSLDAIVLTHHHMDAAAGLDDVRGFQQLHKDYKGSGRPRRIPVPVYLSEYCHKQVQGQFPWLLPPKSPPPPNEEEAGPVVVRDVASFDVTIFQNYQPYNIHGVEIIPLPVWHGDDLVSHGFAFTVRSKSGKPTNVVYLSDISRMIPETLQFIREKLPPTDILVVDALLWHRHNPVHFSMEQALELREGIQPRGKTYFVGMNCDSFLPHDEMNVYLEKEHGDVALAHDGLVIEVE